MQTPRVILDFPVRGRNRERLYLGMPGEVLVATELDQVRPVVQRASAAAGAGAWVAGFIAYEAAPAFDRALCTHAHTGLAPLAWFGVFDEPVAYESPPVAMPSLDSWSPDVSRDDYDDAIARIRDAIAAGDVYQVNHTLRFSAHCDIEPRAVHDAFVTARHGVYHSLIETPDWAIVSASPELFFDLHDGTLTTRPMKGTARRGRWPEEDVATAARLAASAKDRAENLMIVDLLRNDVGRIARFGSVRVNDMFAIETYPTVHQMTSTISAQLHDGITIDDVLAAMFPCGSVTGAPKVAAMKMIHELERTVRGPYCGAIGLIRPDRSATFNVAIRTLLIDRRQNVAVYGAGGGITWDSSAGAEYDEVIAKASLLTECARPFDLLETMRLDNGSIPRLDRHLARLAASACYFGFPDDAERVAAAALERARAASPTGSWRLRLTVSRDANVSLESTPLLENVGALPVGRFVDDADARLVCLARRPIDSNDVMLFHKTTARSLYDALRAECPGAFDVLMYNECGCITEFTIGNVVCEIDGEFVTPPVSAGLLPGTFRGELLEAGIVREKVIRIEDLERVTRMWLVNSVRGWLRTCFQNSDSA